MRFNGLRLAVTALFVGLAIGNAIDLSAPQSGMLFDSTNGSLRSLTGIPGSAFLSKPLVTGLDAAWPSPNGQFAVIVKNGRTSFFERSRDDNDASALIDEPTKVAWNADGTAVALYSAASQSVQCVDAAQARHAQLLRELPGEVTALALRDCANIAVAKGSQVFLLAAGYAPLAVIHAPATSLVLTSNALYAATANCLVEYRSGTRKCVFDRPHISALGLSKAGHLVALHQAITLLDLKGSILREIALEKPAAGLSSLGGSVFLLNGLAQDQSYVIVLDIGREPSVFYVPTAGPNS